VNGPVRGLRRIISGKGTNPCCCTGSPEALRGGMRCGPAARLSREDQLPSRADLAWFGGFPGQGAARRVEKKTPKPRSLRYNGDLSCRCWTSLPSSRCSAVRCSNLETPATTMRGGSGMRASISVRPSSPGVRGGRRRRGGQIRSDERPVDRGARRRSQCRRARPLRRRNRDRPFEDAVGPCETGGFHGEGTGRGDTR
jgi:hypothetical protein